ncbi:hypothetical protein Ga0074812_11247 [Parafrankia irregularis]|uniref:Secreted protein n=1 Tax=Parafrankia irregularis TaxID=795642 RepID=A0A0S4QNX0_9ACTN|nr:MULTISPECIES: hypothetical protein [Parafrankia]MBE3201647.1 hypothetical protein [Parafrankia sp. CH37]CUU57387.1 hypothetical protein Ga0074812_11247 [Parafrankia irregularis]
MTIRNKITILVAGLLSALAALTATAGTANAASPAAAPGLAATLAAQAAASTGPLCSPTRPATPAPGVGTAQFTFNREFLLALARAGVIAYSTAPGQTSVCLNPLSERLTFPLEPPQYGAGTITAQIDGQLVFRKVVTGATVSLSLRTFSHTAIGNWIFINADVPLAEQILFSVGLPDATGAYPLGFSRPEVVSVPLGVTFTFHGQAGTVATAYPTP